MQLNLVQPAKVVLRFVFPLVLYLFSLPSSVTHFVHPLVGEYVIACAEASALNGPNWQ